MLKHFLVKKENKNIKFVSESRIHNLAQKVQQTHQQKLTFSKHDRLKSKKRIAEIFEQGLKIKQYPFVLHYLPVESVCSQVQIVVSVPKKKIKSAVKRNRLKRQIKEAYRLNKPKFYKQLVQKNQKLALFLVFIGKEKEDYHYLEKNLTLLLNQLIEKL